MGEQWAPEGQEDAAATAPPTQAPARAPEPLPLQTQLVRFVATGVLSAVVDFGLLVLLMAAGLGHTVAKSISWVAGTVTAYAINRKWTFRAAPSTRRFLAVATLYLITFALQVGIFSLLFDPLQDTLGATGAQVVGFVIAQGVATTVNFLVQRAVIFRAP